MECLRLVLIKEMLINTLVQILPVWFVSLRSEEVVIIFADGRN